MVSRQAHNLMVKLAHHCISIFCSATDAPWHVRYFSREGVWVNLLPFQREFARGDRLEGHRRRWQRGWRKRQQGPRDALQEGNPHLTLLGILSSHRVSDMYKRIPLHWARLKGRSQVVWMLQVRPDRSGKEEQEQISPTWDHLLSDPSQLRDHECWFSPE